MKVPKPDHNYWFNFGTQYSGEPFFRILITREVKEDYLRETLEYFSNTMFSARIDIIRYGPNLQTTDDEDLLKARFPYPTNESKYIVASSILGFEFSVEKRDNLRVGHFYYFNNAIKYRVEESISETQKVYKYAASVHGTPVQIFPQIQMTFMGDEWETKYYLAPRNDEVTPRTYTEAFEGLFGVPLQFNCFWGGKIIEKKWPLNYVPSCRSVSLHW